MSQKLLIPALGTVLKLTEDWNFKLYFERRNKGLLRAFCPVPAPKPPKATGPGSWAAKYEAKNWGVKPEHFGKDCPLLRVQKAMTKEELKDSYRTFRSTNAEDKFYVDATLLAGTQLIVDRIYIRQGIEAYNSVTFRTTKVGPDKKLHSKRFWAKLQDVNKACVEVVI